jgi:hypothetical protein
MESLMSEHAEQCALFTWARMYEERFPPLKWMFAVPNGGYRMAKTARDLKAEGVKAGVPDIIFPVRRLVIEMKYGNNKPTREQKEWLEYFEYIGWRVVVCYSWQEAAKAIISTLSYIDPKEVGL